MNARKDLNSGVQKIVIFIVIGSLVLWIYSMTAAQSGLDCLFLGIGGILLGSNLLFHYQKKEISIGMVPVCGFGCTFSFLVLRQEGWIWNALWICALLIDLYFCIGFRCLYSTGKQQPTIEDSDVFLILGAGILPTKPLIELQRKLDRAVELNQGGNHFMICSGGDIEYPGIPEAQIMKAYLIQQGIPSEQIQMESASSTTQENLQNSRALLSEQQLEHLVYITSHYHAYRVSCLMKRMKLPGKIATSTVPVQEVLQDWSREVMAVTYFKWIVRDL